MEAVFLAMPGPWADDTYEASDHYTTKIGGLPDWPFLKAFLRPRILQCSACGSELCLISQVFAPISGATLKIEERVIYVFGCTNSHCKSWRAIRVQKSDISEESKTANRQDSLSSVSSASVSASKCWDNLDLAAPGGEGNCGDDEDIDLEELGRALSAAASLASTSKKQTIKKHSETKENELSLSPKVREVDNNILVLPCFYIYSEEEKSFKDVLSVGSCISSLSTKENRSDDDDHLPEEAWETEAYEYDRALHADRTYLKFKKRMDAYPEQCLRYSYGGKPLLATTELRDPGKCGICGGSRHYEMQLMPPLLYFLQEAADGGKKDLLENWNWMTLIVYTCQKSCFGKVDQDMPSTEGWTVAEEAVTAQFENLHESAQLGYFS